MENQLGVSMNGKLVGTINGGTPIAGWFRMEHPNFIWMMTRGTPVLGNHQKGMDNNGI